MQARDQKGRFITSAAHAAFRAERVTAPGANYPPTLPTHAPGTHPRPLPPAAASSPAASAHVVTPTLAERVATLVHKAGSGLAAQARALAMRNRSAE